MNLLVITAVLALLGLVGVEADQPLARQERRFEQRKNHHLHQILVASKNEEIDLIEEDDNDDNEVVEVDVDILTPTSSNRGLVPQLWPNYTGLIEPEPETVSCSWAQQKCAFRAGCGLALQNYVLGCSDLAEGRTKVCNDHCRHSLISLMSTHEGQRLMKCNCSGDDYCETSKKNIKFCRDEVLHATQEDTIVTCSAAQWICAADPQCSTALDYYNRNCDSMFRGSFCSSRCLNSIRILQRQAAAKKLETCRCTGQEAFQCEEIKSNMDRLCLNPPIDDNEIDTDGHGHKSSSAGFNLQKVHKYLLLVTLCITTIFHALLDLFRSLGSSSEVEPNGA